MALCLWLWAASAGATAAAPVIVVLGDSISAGYGLGDRAGWVELLQQRLRRGGQPHRVVNASISGDTTRAALGRVDQLLRRHQPAIVIIELGGNDGLRGLPLQALTHNLEQIVERSLQHNAAVLLVGMRLPPNYGALFNRAFEGVYRSLAERYPIQWLPFLFEGFAADQSQFQRDGIHPRASAQTVMLDSVWRYLAPMLENRSVKPAAR
ncbi:MAG: arylesterase [Gammaproteobacteria bacterium]|nr:arylesterase [Gammaproteobacteria bacterium]